MTLMSDGSQINPHNASLPTINLDPQYAKLTVDIWANVQIGQEVVIICDSIHNELASHIEESAYSRGASKVHPVFTNQNEDRNRILDSSLSINDLSKLDQQLHDLASHIANVKGVSIRIVGRPDPDAFKDLDPARADALEKGHQLSLHPLTEVVMKGLTNRAVIAAPTVGWAHKVFPELPPEVAFEKLQRIIYQVSCVSAENPMEEFLRQDAILERQRDKLQGLNLTGLRFVDEGTDLFVGLSEKALWLGAKKSTYGTNIPFYANVPIGEIFTTPDWRVTNGTVRITMPTIISGQIVDGIELKFKDGDLVGYSAKDGDAVLSHMIKRDMGAQRLGEIALVSMDSPLAQLGILFNEILLDEKGRCHLAMGRAYLSNIIGGALVDEVGIKTLGVNLPTSVHQDLMISGGNTKVIGIARGGKEVPLLEHGIWIN